VVAGSWYSVLGSVVGEGSSGCGAGAGVDSGVGAGVDAESEVGDATPVLADSEVEAELGFVVGVTISLLIGAIGDLDVSKSAGWAVHPTMANAASTAAVVAPTRMTFMMGIFPVETRPPEDR